MGEKTDKVAGRAEQAAGALTGDEDRKREGEKREAKGEAKGKVDDAVDRAKDALDGLRDKVTKK